MDKVTPEDLTRYSQVLEKAAEYIEELEEKTQAHEKQAQEALTKPYMEKLAQLGFSENELENLAKLPVDTLDALEKRAASGGSSAWEMGEGGRMASSEMDPFTSWLLS